MAWKAATRARIVSAFCRKWCDVTAATRWFRAIRATTGAPPVPVPPRRQCRHEGGHEQPAERERPGGEVLARGADAAEIAQSWEEALAEFERSLLGRLFPHFPSSRKLAARLNTSHTMIANKLRRYGIPHRR